MRSKCLNSKEKRSNPKSRNWFFVYFIFDPVFFSRHHFLLSLPFLGAKFWWTFLPAQEVSRIQQALNLDFVVASDSEESDSSSLAGGLEKKSLVNFWMCFFCFFWGGRGKGVWKRGICWNNLRKSRGNFVEMMCCYFFWMGQVVVCISVKRWHHQNCWIFFLRGKPGAKEA